MLARAAADLAAAAALLTRAPVPVDHAHAGRRGARAAWAWPVVGAALGGAAAAALAGGLALGLPPGPAAAAALAALVLATGALHEDGLADLADGLGGGRDRARALEIMRDSRIGAFGAAALLLAFLARWSALAALA
ncbi:MAG: adenosylcobinamide-GDP ribazoletransferase, partial [Pseudomonadota bacterium]